MTGGGAKVAFFTKAGPDMCKSKHHSQRGFSWKTPVRPKTKGALRLRSKYSGCKAPAREGSNRCFR